MDLTAGLRLWLRIMGHLDRRFKVSVGQLEKITCTSEKNGFTVVSVKVSGLRDLLRVVGGLLAPMPSEIIRMQGEWANQPTANLQSSIPVCIV
jgi:hypothetical protein